LNIVWPLAGEPNLSAKDRQAKSFREAELFA
jgi:dTDP-4-dehydrorhamnose 3,5-epimerase-like enzyme